jgi:hypothetical protein
MTELDDLDDGTCPYLRPNIGEPPTVLTVGVYCGLPSGSARVPSRDELIRFCVAGHHGDCPGYRLARLRETFAAVVA